VYEKGAAMIRTEPKRDVIFEKQLPPKTVITPEIVQEAIAEAFAPPKPVGSFVIPKGRPVTGNAKLPVTLRLDRDVVEALQARGVDWRAFAGDALRRALNL
jgi:uncharacterized protein (DUF4415 family)